MFDKQYFEHVNSSGQGPSYWVEQAGYQYITIGENLAEGNFRDDTTLVQAWMDSPGHRANILNTRYTEIGVAVGKGTFDGRVTWLAVQEFGLPLSACPPIDKTIKDQITTNQATLDQKQQVLETKKQELEATEPKRGDNYKQKVNEYNALVNEYNALVKQLKAQADAYNASVNAFNACVAQ
jgi:outer membrane murein-binding lipoprotein Lpp